MVFAVGTSLRVLAIFSIKRHGVFVAHAVAAEDVERGADGEVDPPLAKRGDTLQILHRLGSAGVGGGDGAVLGDESDEIFVDPLAKPLDVDAMNEKFVAALGQTAQRVGVDAEVGESLPTIGNDEVIAVAPAAAEVDDEPRLAKRLAELVESTLIELAVAKEPRGNDNVRCPGIDPFGRVVGRDAAADLQPTWPCGECLACGIVVSLTQLDDVATA